MTRAKRASKLPNGSLPPTFSPETGKRFFDGLAQYPPPSNELSDQYLEKIGITEGTRAALLGGLRWSGVINRDEIRLNDTSLPIRLRNPNTRKQVFIEILNYTYPELMSFTDLDHYNYDSLKEYFEEKHIKETSSARVTRCFMFLAQEAGIKLAEQLPPISLRPDVSLRSKINVPAPFQLQKSSTSDNTGAKVRLLMALHKNLEAGAPVTSEMLEMLTRLTEEVGHLLPPQA